ncbi:telomerase reverse transcriptase [Ceraceosorus bombacis]|uniref:Telomerase reverse transcriptase n=1 Tax=Ceraceosorus bombacis TaxID=401625 RepID=A0A0P1BIP6_9BASI|nr:telomerase reverse transcriptase [Ceraceosorus bombacis]
MADDRAPLCHRGEGLTNFQLNTNVTSITVDSQWANLLRSLGANVFIHLLTNASIFAPIAHSDDCWMQLTGVPISDLEEQSVAHSDETPVAPKVAPRRRRKRSKRHDAEPSLLPLQRGPFQKTVSLPVGAFDRRPAPSESLRAFNGAALKRKFGGKSQMSQKRRKHTEITFVRSRIFYARPIRTRAGRIAVGLPINHVFNRTASVADLLKALRKHPSKRGSSASPIPADGSAHKHATQLGPLTLAESKKHKLMRVQHVMKHVWPLEYGLHNVFTSSRDWKKTSQPFQEYGNRDVEIAAKGQIKTPLRLKKARHLIAIMLHKHDRLDYRRMSDIMCRSLLPRRRLTEHDRDEIAFNMAELPGSSQFARGGSLGPTASSSQLPPTTQAHEDDLEPASGAPQSREHLDQISMQVATQARDKPRFIRYAQPTGQVARYVCAVIRSTVPIDLLGSRLNYGKFQRAVRQFVHARRYESVNMHQLLDGLRLNDVTWLQTPSLRASAQRCTAAEHARRESLLAEVLFYVVDSLVMPLLRTTFYVTEAAAYRNRVLYFRQDDWAIVCAPLLNRLKGTTFEPVPRTEALATILERKLGYSHIRFLPKETGVRPIVNLRRRSLRRVAGSNNSASSNSGDATLGRSINSVMQNAFQILTHERTSQPHMLGASVFGLNDIYKRLKDFAPTVRDRLKKNGSRLYFVKVDIVAAFDTIVQDKLMAIVKYLLRDQDGYVIQRFTQMVSAAGKAKKTFVRRACPEAQQGSFASLAEEIARSLRNAVLADSVNYPYEDRVDLLHLLDQHVNDNLVKIGRDFYRQRVGIPQGSSLSTMLCCFYLAQLEKEKLAFTQKPGCLLIRYVDDFLFISTSKRRATHFFHTMERGYPDYGSSISPDKTLANFDLSVSGTGAFVPRTHTDFFPWCGILINSKILSVRTDLSRYAAMQIGDTLTVEQGRRPGITLAQKTKQALKSRAHIIYNDTDLNPHVVVHQNIYEGFLVAAMKLVAYLKTLKGQAPADRARLCLHVLNKATRTMYNEIVLAARAAAKVLHPGSTSRLEALHVQWLGLHAFHSVLSTRVGHYGTVLRELKMKMLAGHYRSARRRLEPRATRYLAESAATLRQVRY